MYKKLILILSLIGLIQMNASAHNPGGAFIAAVIIPSFVSLLLSIFISVKYVSKIVVNQKKLLRFVILFLINAVLFLVLAVLISVSLGTFLYVNFFE